MLELKSLLHVPNVDAYNGFDISPDGRKVAFSWNKTGQWEIYEISLIGRQNPQCISAGPGSKFCPKYSPEGTRIAYVVDFDGSEHFHLILRDFISGASTDLTPGIKYSLQPNISWSPEGNGIAFLADLHLHYEACVMDLSGPTDQHKDAPTLFPIRLLISIDRPGWNVNWSPDGNWLAVVFEGPGQDYQTYMVSRDGKEKSVIAFDGKPIDARSPAWSPDGKRLAFSSDVSGWHNIGILDRGSKDIFWLIESRCERSSPDWSPAGNNLIYVSADGAETWLELYKEGDQPLRLQQIEPGMHFSPSFSPDGDSIIFIYDNPGHPDDLWQISFRDRSLRQLTHSLPVSLRNTCFIMPDEVIYPSFDHEIVPAILYRPTGPNPQKKAIIFIHGGPTWHFSFTWYPIMSYLVSQGWVVLAPNYRGSTGYGHEWQTLNRFDLGGGDTDDCAAGANYLVREGLADPARIVVTGRSHGGYLTMSCLTRYPSLWAGGSAIVPFLNLFNCHEELREDLKHWDIENMGNPEENYELWHERSPFFHLDNVRAPVQIMCGENDQRCPVSDSILARDRLIELDQQVNFKIYPGEGHTFFNIDNVIDSEERRVDFIENCMKLSTLKK